jgi:hypothetical protein
MAFDSNIVVHLNIKSTPNPTIDHVGLAFTHLVRQTIYGPSIYGPILRLEIGYKRQSD